MGADNGKKNCQSVVRPTGKKYSKTMGSKYLTVLPQINTTKRDLISDQVPFILLYMKGDRMKRYSWLFVNIIPFFIGWLIGAVIHEKSMFPMWFCWTMLVTLLSVESFYIYRRYHEIKLERIRS